MQTNNKLSSEKTKQQSLFAKKTTLQEPFAEVIESCLDSFTAHCWQWDQTPSFGSLVQVTTNDRTIFGCVTSIETGSIDPSRSPFPYQKTVEELKAEQPQIFEYLKTTFTAQIIGYRENTGPEEFSYLLPQQLTSIHSFVQESPSETTKAIFTDQQFLHLLFAFQKKIPNLDELLLVITKQLFEQDSSWHKEKFAAFCQTFSLLTGNDYRRLKTFLQRVESLQKGR